MGVKRTVERIRSRAYWPRVTDTVKRFCERCEQCQKKKTPAKSPKAPMKTYVSGTPNERVQIDILGPLVESYKSNKYIIVLTDCFTKWASAYAVPRATATEVADAILDWTAQFGVMKILHSDQGRQMDLHCLPEANFKDGGSSVMILGRLPECAFYESLTCLFTFENDACLSLGNSTVLAAIFFGTIQPILYSCRIFGTRSANRIM